MRMTGSSRNQPFQDWILRQIFSFSIFPHITHFHLRREHGVPDMCVSLTRPNGRLLVINGQKKMCVSCMTAIKSRSLFYFSFLQARIQWRLIASNLHSNYKHETPLKVSFCFIFINSQLKQLECRDDYCMSVFRLRDSLFWVLFFFLLSLHDDDVVLGGGRHVMCVMWWGLICHTELYIKNVFFCVFNFLRRFRPVWSGWA